MKKIVAWLFRAIDVFSIVFLVLLVLLVFAQVVFRYTHVPSPWTEELARYCFVYLAFLGSVLALRGETHISIDILLDALPPRAKHAIRGVGHILIALFTLLFTRGMILTIQTSGDVRSASLLWFKMNYVYAAVLFSAVMMVIICLVHTARHFSLVVRPAAPKGGKAA